MKVYWLIANLMKINIITDFVVHMKLTLIFIVVLVSDLDDNQGVLFSIILHHLCRHAHRRSVDTILGNYLNDSSLHSLFLLVNPAG